MVRKFKPKNIIEIGTWIGSTTYFLARGLFDNDNKDSKLYTYDLNNKCLINDESLLNYIVLNSNNYAHNLMKNLNVHIDMVFLDANLDKITCLELLKHCNKDTIFITHDFVPFVDKGCTALLTLITNMNLKYKWFIPNKNVNYTLKNFTNYKETHYVEIENKLFKLNGCCGCLIPYNTINILPNKITNYEIDKKENEHTPEVNILQHPDEHSTSENEDNYKKISFRINEKNSSNLILIECDDKIPPSNSHTELLNNNIVGMDNSTEHGELKFIKTIDNGIYNISCHVKKKSSYIIVGNYNSLKINELNNNSFYDLPKIIGYVNLTGEDVEGEI
jgi:hypothetical protein